MAARLRFLGHGTVLLDLGGLRILTDPLLRSRIGPLERRVPPLRPADHAGIDVVLVSHLHHDHFDPPSLALLDGEPLVIGPPGTRRLLHRSAAVVELVPGRSHRLDGWRVTATPAAHSGFRPPVGPRSVALGFLLDDGRRRIYAAGDTDLFPGMRSLGPLDLALLPIWGWGPTLGPGHLDPIRAARALGLLRPRWAVPIHWGTYWPRLVGRLAPGRFAGPAAAFAAAAAEMAPLVRVAPLPPGAGTLRLD
jgi:L-ascorbate metabolism protein UlaG (beta-lactamase superfamily)